MTVDILNGSLEYNVRLKNVDPLVQPIFKDVLAIMGDAMQHLATKVNPALTALRDDNDKLRQEVDHLHAQMQQLEQMNEHAQRAATLRRPEVRLDVFGRPIGPDGRTIGPAPGAGGPDGGAQPPVVHNSAPPPRTNHSAQPPPPPAPPHNNGYCEDRMQTAAEWAQPPPPACSPPAEGNVVRPPPPARRVDAAPPASAFFSLAQHIRVHEAPVHAVDLQCLADGSPPIIATASWDQTCKIVDVKTGETKRTLQGGTNGNPDMGGLYAVAFSKTAPHILGCTSVDQHVYLWNHHTGEMQKKLTGHTDEVNSIDFHTTQQVVCTASDDMKVVVWDFQEGIILRTLEKHDKAVYGATFMGKENQFNVASCCFDMRTRIFDMRDKKVVQTIEDHRGDVIGISYNAAKNYLATGSDDGKIMVYDVRYLLKNGGPAGGNTSPVFSFNVNSRQQQTDNEVEVKRVAFSPDGNLLAAGCSSGEVLVYDMNKGESGTAQALGIHTDCVFDVAWGECSQTNQYLLASASHDNTCAYWRCPMGGTNMVLQ